MARFGFRKGLKNDGGTIKTDRAEAVSNIRWIMPAVDRRVQALGDEMLVLAWRQPPGGHAGFCRAEMKSTGISGEMPVLFVFK